jgi:hypothetical protein
MTIRDYMAAKALDYVSRNTSIMRKLKDSKMDGETGWLTHI